MYQPAYTALSIEGVKYAPAQAGLLACGSSSNPLLPILSGGQWIACGFSHRYSGGTARDSHPIPFSPHNEAPVRPVFGF